MCLPHSPQLPTQIVQIEGWQADEDYAIFPSGAKPKRTFVCPHGVTQPFLIEGHRYLFKVAVAADFRAYQCWSEVIAYEIGNMLGLDVPPSFIAVNGKTGEMGALVEFFYGYPGNDTPLEFTHGSDELQRFYSGAYDSGPGRPHTVCDNVDTCQNLAIPDPTIWWARAFAFDALIGNTDRHPHNWGYFSRTTNEETRCSLAPIFDNATSLGYELTGAQLANEWSAQLISDYIKRGTHHCSWSREDRKGMPHVELCTRFCETYPLASVEMKHVIGIADSEIEAMLNRCTEFVVPIRFDAARAVFVAALTKARRNALARSLGD
jgi:hypothetical protein